MRPLLPEFFTSQEWACLREQFELPSRQVDIARLICRGCTNESIAARLGISEATVRMHSDRLYKRIGVQSRLGVLLRFALALRDGKDGNAC